MCGRAYIMCKQMFQKPPTFLFSAARFPGPPRPTGGPPTAGCAGAAGEVVQRNSHIIHGNP